MTSRLAGLPLRRKLTLISMATSCAALLLACLSFVTYELVTFPRSMVRELGTLAEIIGTNSTAALAFADPKAAGETLSALAAEPNIVAAAVFGRDGRLLARYQRPGRSEPTPAAPPLGRAGSTFAGDRLLLYRPVRLGGEPLGAVVVLADLGELRARLRRYAGMTFVVLIASALVALLVSSRLQGVIARPIVHLVATADRVSREKDYSVRATKHGNDELGQLIDAFNEMLGQIAERERQLGEAHLDLERRVQERTAELQQEIAARQRVEETIRQLAYFDALTGLPNRVLFNDRLTQALAYAERNGEMVAVLLLDLDRFKTINDTLGHGMGDKVLKAVAQRLRGCLRGEDTVARIGGDEFPVLLPGVRAIEDATKVAEKIVEALRPPLEIDGHRLYTTSSVGIALYPIHGRDGVTLIKNADTALYRAKDHGRDNHQVYTAGSGDRALERLVLENSLRRALEQHELVLHYQPQVDPASGTIVALEALLRWTHPELGLLLPSAFVGLAEETGLILPMGEWVLHTACVQARAWRDAGLPVRMAVNLSPRHFGQRDLVERVERVLAETGVPPDALTIEVREGVVLEAAEGAIALMRDLRTLGVHLAVDDFGTGYSSLAYLKRLPADSLKIDQSFVQDLPVDAGNAAIVQLIVTMAHSLGLAVVAEGVETEAQYEFLVPRGCDILQGDLFSRPVRAQEATVLLKQGRIGPRAGTRAQA